jgi:hypothetical protein
LLSSLIAHTQTTSISTLTNNFNIINPGTITTSILRNTGSAPHKQLLASYTSLATESLNAYATSQGTSFKLGATRLASVSSITCPSSSAAGSLCHSVSATYQLNYTVEAFPASPKPSTVAVNKIQDLINAGKLDCKLTALYPRAVLVVSTGGGCSGGGTVTTPEYDATGTLSTTFIIFNSAGLSAATLGQANNAQRLELVAAYNAVIQDVLKGTFAKGAVLDGTPTIGTFKDSSCFGLTGGICHSVVGSINIKYASKNGNLAQEASPILTSAISAGLLICYHEKLYPNSVVTIISGNSCKATPNPAITPSPARTPTRAPTVRTPTRTPTMRTPTMSPVMPVSTTFNTLATLTNNFRTINPGSISKSVLMNASGASQKQLLAAYDALVKKRMATFQAQGPLNYLGVKIGPIADDSCLSGAAAGSKCHAVTVTFQVSYIPTDFTVAPGSALVNWVQNAINAGELDCELKRLYPRTILSVTTGGTCKK